MAEDHCRVGAGSRLPILVWPLLSVPLSSVTAPNTTNQLWKKGEMGSGAMSLDFAESRTQPYSPPCIPSCTCSSIAHHETFSTKGPRL